ncbi:hypothetical protein VKT23_009696 [Stygiomarasmius scandens]|uniref:ER-bound oxygenase mpaB/mpaB'/Rubber oxygenase catalytic domain-containing protein n=1 Tax=Marasmiellus scandens TaxID=2682957 RepID=A0ABR1JD40_9AGAR
MAKYEAGTLTPEDAQKILTSSLAYEMPSVLGYALSFALFKTYGIPSISKILKGTGELSSKDGISKRYTDTAILIATWVACPITGKTYKDEDEALISKSFFSNTGSEAEDDPRAMISLARVNWLHAKYPIRNEDYLYTLALFAFEPERWAKRYGWRELSLLECEAYYIYWREIGNRMGIKNIPDSAEDFKTWAEDYELRTMVPAESNHFVANYTLEELLHILPEQFGIKNFARRISITLLDDIVREAMMYPAQPPIMHFSVHNFLRSMGFVQRHLCLPRIWTDGPVEAKLPDFAKISSGCLSMKSTSTEKAGDVQLYRMHPRQFTQRPWYMPEPTSLLGYARARFAVWAGLYEEMPSRKLRSEGYRLEELGPLKYEHSGHEEVLKMAERLQGHPITGPWARN